MKKTVSLIASFFLFFNIFLSSNIAYARSNLDTGHYFNGGVFTYSNVRGISAWITAYNPYVDSYSGVANWVMLNNNNMTANWAQIGYLNGKPTGWTNGFFYQYTNSDLSVNIVRSFGGTSTPASSNQFEASMDSANYVYLRTNGIDELVVPNNILQYTTDVEISAETQNTNDQCPGDYLYQVSVSGTYYKTTAGYWYSAPQFANPFGYHQGTFSYFVNDMNPNLCSGWSIYDSRSQFN